MGGDWRREAGESSNGRQGESQESPIFLVLSDLLIDARGIREAVRGAGCLSARKNASQLLEIRCFVASLLPSRPSRFHSQQYEMGIKIVKAHTH